MSRMSTLHMLIVGALEAGLSDENTITLMVEEGVPLEACSEILRVFKEQVTEKA
jgi:hypothetical protein